ncbi:MAG TPA: DUF1178 family protein [bacterium]|nr:DUF1178 family protein [bacterium]
MIIYGLSCRRGHRFEGWFPHAEDFEAQKEKGLLSCQVCGDTCIEKAALAKASTVSSFETQTLAVSADLDAATVLKAVRHYVTTHFENVGDRFAETVRAISRGEEKGRPIFGQASPEEREKLEEEGLPCAVLPELGDEYKN